ncbi:serine hydrolase [Nonomuraea sp. KM88]|uniref:serine hydrolase n=1 Tax=Nonomuraea sp. KM88 TaxID=3457427 RepID=UPI003FCC7473
MGRLHAPDGAVLRGLTRSSSAPPPLGLEHSTTLPEEALRFRMAMGHQDEPGQDSESAPVWDLMPRPAGPYGRVIVSAGDVARFAKMHLDGGLAADGTRVLSTDTVAAMQRREVDSPDGWSMSADGWDLGWTLHDWNGIPGSATGDRPCSCAYWPGVAPVR